MWTELVWSVAQMGYGAFKQRTASTPNPTPSPTSAPPSVVFVPLQSVSNLPALQSLPSLQSLDAALGASTAPSAPPHSSGPTIPVSAFAETSYSDQVAQGIACAACTKDHLATMVGASEDLVTKAHQGDEAGVRYALARIAAEAAVLDQYDWAPDKIAATPKDRLVAVEAVQPTIRALQQTLPVPPSLARAWGDCDEALRFAEGAPTDRDRAEITLRLQDADQQIAYTERVLLAPEHTATMDPATVQQARSSLRAARHILADGNPMDRAVLTQASAQLSAATVALTPTVTPAQAQAIQTQLREAKQKFYRAYFHRT